MINVVIIAVLCVIAFIGIRESVKHIQGKGGCCGGGSSVVLIDPKPVDKVIAVKEISIDGMKCENCSARVQNALNSLANVNATVNLKKKTAVVKLGEGVTDSELKSAIEEKGYSVTKITSL